MASLSTPWSRCTRFRPTFKARRVIHRPRLSRKHESAKSPCYRKSTHVLRDERETCRKKSRVCAPNSRALRVNWLRSGTRTAIVADAASRYENLLAKDYISKDQAQQHQADLLDQQSKLESLERDRTGMLQSLHEANSSLAESSLQHQNQIAQIQREVIAVDQTMIESEAKRESFRPRGGHSHCCDRTTRAGSGHRTTTREHRAWRHALAGLSVRAECRYCFVRVGDPVLLRYQAFPYQKFGYQASVGSIARNAPSAAELATSGIQSASDRTYYRITVALNTDGYGLR